MAVKHIWKKYSIDTEKELSVIAQYSYSRNGTTKKDLVDHPSGYKLYYSTSYQINSDGTFTLTGTIYSGSPRANTYAAFSMYKKYYYAFGSSSNVAKLITVSKDSDSYRFTYVSLGSYAVGPPYRLKTYFLDSTVSGTITLYTSKSTTIQGSTDYGTVMADSASAYPTNGESGGYWYVYQGTASINYTAVDGAVKEVKTAVCVDGAIKTNVSVAHGVNGVVKLS